MALNAEAPPPLDERLKQTARRGRIMIVAGEASGDLHGGDLAREILARDPSCDLFGIAGEKMRAAGVRAIVKTEAGGLFRHIDVDRGTGKKSHGDECELSCEHHHCVL